MKLPDLKVEAFSMIPVRIVDSMIIMSKAEVQVTVEEISGRALSKAEVENLPGTEGPSCFEKLFDEPEDVTDYE